MSNNIPQISVIIPIYNGSTWIKKCFDSILKQTALNVVNFEICVCNDSSTDNTVDLLNNYVNEFKKYNVDFKIYNNERNMPSGVGYSKNKAVSISSGKYLCFQDIDDEMLPNRILTQYEHALNENDNVILGCQFKRDPDNSTLRYVKWANSLTQEQLNNQVFTSHGPTVIMPTWFCHRRVFDRVGGFDESKQHGTPEDLVFFNRHLDLGGKIKRVDSVLVIYRFHVDQTTFTIHEDTIWNLRLERLERVVLSRWNAFTIWNAGKQGRKFYNCLTDENKSKVRCFCDVDKNKIGKKYLNFNKNERKIGSEVDIVHFMDAVPPFVICIKIDLTDGVFEDNLKALNLREGTDYVLFS